MNNALIYNPAGWLDQFFTDFDKAWVGHKKSFSPAIDIVASGAMAGCGARSGDEVTIVPSRSRPTRRQRPACATAAAFFAWISATC